MLTNIQLSSDKETHHRMIEYLHQTNDIHAIVSALYASTIHHNDVFDVSNTSSAFIQTLIACEEYDILKSWVYNISLCSSAPMFAWQDLVKICITLNYFPEKICKRVFDILSFTSDYWPVMLSWGDDAAPFLRHQDLTALKSEIPYNMRSALPPLLTALFADNPTNEQITRIMMFDLELDQTKTFDNISEMTLLSS